MDRGRLIQSVRDRLDGRELVWFGTRGDDAEALTDLPEFKTSFSIINAYHRRSSVSSLAHEDIVGHRVDLDQYDIDDELASSGVRDFRRSVLRELNRPSVVLTYRPSVFLSSICFARRDRCQYLGMFKDHQDAFEHKPWVETELSTAGVAGIPWIYVADEDQLDSLHLLDEGPVVLRSSRSSGGTGLTLVSSQAELEDAWPKQEEAYVSVAPYLDGGLPLNVGAVVWDDGITLHHLSLQLIGVDGLTTRPFGYCGNDFEIVDQLEPSVIQNIENASLTAGRWLQGQGYRGAFGVDFLVVDGTPLFTEVNPRLQGSTHASCQLSIRADESCILLEHLASLMHLPSPSSHHLTDLAKDADPLSHFVVHSLASEPVCFDTSGLSTRLSSEPCTSRIDVTVPVDTVIDPGAMAMRVTTSSRISCDGFSIDPKWMDLIGQCTSGSGEPDDTLNSVGNVQRRRV